MASSLTSPNGAAQHWVVVRPELPGHFTAQVVGLPELEATAATSDEAVQQVRALFSEWLASNQLVPLAVPDANPLLSFPAHLDPNDPLEQQFVEELARLRREDLERTLREDDPECSNSSSTPTT